LEERERYELALVAAFNSIERLFGVNDIKARELHRVFSSLPYASVIQTGEYIRRFEIFSGYKKRTTLGEMVLHFLRL
jgi:hypothetical protein